MVSRVLGNDPAVTTRRDHTRPGPRPVTCRTDRPSANVHAVASNPKSLAQQLSRRGPHSVLRGDLALAGQPGVVYTPAEGFGLPAVAFGHGWLTGTSNYVKLLEHLASWGIVAAAPNTERGPVPLPGSAWKDFL